MGNSDHGTTHTYMQCHGRSYPHRPYRTLKPLTRLAHLFLSHFSSSSALPFSLPPADS